jgi:hypothetical protein
MTTVRLLAEVSYGSRKGTFYAKDLRSAAEGGGT